MASARRYLAGVQVDWSKIDAYLDASLDGLRYQHPLVRRVAFDALASIETVRTCLDWLEVKEPSNLEMLMHMRIESDLAWNLALLKQKEAA